MPARFNTEMTKRDGSDKISDYFPFYEDEVNIKIIFESPPKCPECGETLGLRSVIPDWFPYLHTDLALVCPRDGQKYVFGIPKNKIAGLSLIIYDSSPREALLAFMDMGERECPWGHGMMYFTKIFGDWFPDDEVLEYQWKCPVCFVTLHESGPREFSHGSIPLNERERKIIKERLRALGYMD